jgi:hypothetical protein
MEPKQRRFSVGYTIGTIIALLLIQSYLFAPHPETLAYSDFIRLLKAGKVSDLTLSNQTIWGTLAANGMLTIRWFYAIRDSPSLKRGTGNPIALTHREVGTQTPATKART